MNPDIMNRGGKIIKLKGELEIDCFRGVIYFHKNNGATALRICRLGELPDDAEFIDITHMIGINTS